MEDFWDVLHFGRLVIVLLTLLGVYLILLGTAVAGLANALKERDKQDWK